MFVGINVGWSAGDHAVGCVIVKSVEQNAFACQPQSNGMCFGGRGFGFGEKV